MSERSFEGLIAAQVQLVIALEKTVLLIRDICATDRHEGAEVAAEENREMEAKE